MSAAGGLLGNTMTRLQSLTSYRVSFLLSSSARALLFADRETHMVYDVLFCRGIVHSLSFVW